MTKNDVGGIEKSESSFSKKKCKICCYTLLQLMKQSNLHYHFEIIHPFQDDNGRVSILIMFKECSKHNLVPILIVDEF